jgi:hypothetical protein
VGIHAGICSILNLYNAEGCDSLWSLVLTLPAAAAAGREVVAMADLDSSVLVVTLQCERRGAVVSLPAVWYCAGMVVDIGHSGGP